MSPFLKIVAKGYINYTGLQERLSPNLQKLLNLIKVKFQLNLPQNIINDFRKVNKPLMRLTNIVQFNTRVIFLFLWLFIDKTWLYFAFDLVVLNLILVYMCVRQEKISKMFYNLIKAGA